MPLKTYRGFFAFDDENDVIYSPFYHGRNAGPGDLLSQEILSFRCNVVNPREKGYEADLRRWSPDAHQLFIWAHGNMTRDGIAGDDGSVVGVRELAEDLARVRLPQEFSGNIILWSCFGGSSGGFGEALWLALRRAGYRRAQLYSPRCATGTINDFIPANRYYKGLMIFGSGQTAGGNVDATVPPTVAAGLPTWIGAKMFSQPSDLRLIAAGQRLVAEV
jgi:hypothetical protein